MFCTRRFAGAGAFFVLVLTTPVIAADSPLSQVPADTPVVVHVRGFEHTKQRLVTMAKNALPYLAPQTWDKFNADIEKALDGRSLKGLPKDGSVFVAIFDLAATFTGNVDEDGVIVEYAVIVQVTSLSDFRDAALKADERKALKKDPAGYEQVRINNRDFYFINREQYAVATPSKALALRFAKKQAGLDSTLPKDLASRLLNADAAVYLNMAALTKTYAEQIKQFRQEVEKIMGQSANLNGAEKSTMEMAKRLASPVFQGMVDTRALVASFHFRPEGWKLRVDASVGKDSKTNTLLEDFKSSAFAELSKLPAGALSYIGMAVDSKLFNDFMPLVLGFLDDPNSPEGKAYIGALQALTEAKPGSMVESFTMPVSGLTVWDYQYPDKAAAAHLEMMQHIKAGNTYMSRVIKGQPELKPNALTYRGFKLHSACYTWDLDNMIGQASGAPIRTDAQKEQMKNVMKKMLGERMNYWFGSNGKSFVMLAGDNWEGARQQLDAYLDGKQTIANDTALQEARKQLPAQATVLSLIDAPRYGELISGFMRASLPLGANRHSNVLFSRDPEGKSSFLGMALTLKTERASFELWIPVAAVAEFRRVFEPLFDSVAELEKLAK
jgi:hypothetical protein